VTVHLIAAGPGDPDLFTVRTERLLAHAPVVVCDRDLLPMLAPLTGPATHVVPVDDVDEAVAVLLDEAGHHDGVVRVAVGDRLVWEAGGAEAAALRAAGLAVVVEPAVVAAFAAPAAAGIPVMTRPLTAMLTVACGVTAPLACSGTVVTDVDAGIAEPPGTVVPAGTGRHLAVSGPVITLDLLGSQPPRGDDR
jgi:uroporphyrin-III C-methyltransferase